LTRKTKNRKQQEQNPCIALQRGEQAKERRSVVDFSFFFFQKKANSKIKQNKTQKNLSLSITIVMMVEMRVLEI